MSEPDYIISLSGGKDSTDMIHQMIDHGNRIAAIVFFDTGWEFPEMYDHIKLIDRNINLKIWRIQPRIPFEYEFFHVGVRSKKTKKIEQYGRGWPSINRRWCTRLKNQALDHFAKAFDNPVQCVGYAFDEKKRAKNNTKYPQRYPLIEYGITEKQALNNCFKRGYHWGGLYDYFDRVSCFCCPLQRIEKLKILRRVRPDLWSKMLEWDANRPAHNKGFKNYKSVHDFEARFALEERISLEMEFPDI